MEPLAFVVWELFDRCRLVTEMLIQKPGEPAPFLIFDFQKKERREPGEDEERLASIKRRYRITGQCDLMEVPAGILCTETAVCQLNRPNVRSLPGHHPFQ